VGIPDFRGPDGLWTCEKQGRPAPGGFDVAAAQPGLTHIALAQLVDAGVVKHIASQNVDGLHRRSGVPAALLSELHGNCLREECWRCGASFERTFDVTRQRNKTCAECLTRVPFFCHCTLRKCPSCKTPLKDTVIHFEEDLPEEALQRSFKEASVADVCLALGTSLLIYPAVDVVRRMTKRKHTKLVVVNKQKTPLDKKCAVRVFGDVDTVMRGVMQQLSVIAPELLAQPAAMPAAPPARLRRTSSAGSSAAASTRGGGGGSGGGGGGSAEVVDELTPAVRPATTRKRRRVCDDE
jgi:mono-ADP-ribosyltransferase sirtuin 6